MRRGECRVRQGRALHRASLACWISHMTEDCANVSIYESWQVPMHGATYAYNNNATGSTHPQQRGHPRTEILGRLGPTSSNAPVAMLSLFENVTDKQYFQAWAIFSSVVFISYYRWPGRRVSPLSVRPIYGLSFLFSPSSTTFLRSDLHPRYYHL